MFKPSVIIFDFEVVADLENTALKMAVEAEKQRKNEGTSFSAGRIKSGGFNGDQLSRSWKNFRKRTITF